MIFTVQLSWIEIVRVGIGPIGLYPEHRNGRVCTVKDVCKIPNQHDCIYLEALHAKIMPTCPVIEPLLAPYYRAVDTPYAANCFIFYNAVL